MSVKTDPVSAFKIDPPFVAQSPQAGRPHIASLSGGFACVTFTFFALFTLDEPVGRVACFDDGAMVRDAIELCGCDLGIAKDRDLLTELQIGRDDGAGLLIELADQMD